MSEPRIISIATDCCDWNAKFRLQTRVGTLFGQIPAFGGVFDDLSLGGTVADGIDAATGEPAIVVGNAAARRGCNSNGSPFGSVQVGKTLVVTTVAGYALSFLQHLGLVNAADVRVFDTEEVLRIAVERGLMDEASAIRAAAAQFRSYEFELHLARWLWDGEDFPSRPLATIPPLLKQIWWIDDGRSGNLKHFGNCKLSVLPEEVDWQPGRPLPIRIGRVPYPVTC